MPSTLFSASTTCASLKAATSSTAPCMRSVSSGASPLKMQSSMGRNSERCSLRSFLEMRFELSFAISRMAADEKEKS